MRDCARGWMDDWMHVWMHGCIHECTEIGRVLYGFLIAEGVREGTIGPGRSLAAIGKGAEREGVGSWGSAGMFSPQCGQSARCRSRILRAP